MPFRDPRSLQKDGSVEGTRFHGKGAGAHRNEGFSARSPGTREAVTSSNCAGQTQPWTQQVRGKDLLFGKRFIASRCVTQQRFFFFFFLGKKRRLPAMIQNAPRHFVKPSHYPLHLGQLLFQQIGNTRQHLLVSHPLFLMSSKSFV